MACQTADASLEPNSSVEGFAQPASPVALMLLVPSPVSALEPG
jgi:hypothetical protein